MIIYYFWHTKEQYFNEIQVMHDAKFPTTR